MIITTLLRLASRDRLMSRTEKNRKGIGLEICQTKSGLDSGFSGRCLIRIGKFSNFNCRFSSGYGKNYWTKHLEFNTLNCSSIASQLLIDICNQDMSVFGILQDALEDQ